MRRCLVLSLLALVATLPAVDVVVSAVPAVKVLEQRDWDPNEVQGELAIQVAVKPWAPPIALVANAMAAGASDHEDDDTGDTWRDGSTGEIQLGVQLLLELPGRFHPFAGGGVTFASAEQQIETASSVRSDGGWGVGGWASAGAFWTIRRFVLGGQVGWSSAEVDLGPRTVDAGGWRFGVILGGCF